MSVRSDLGRFLCLLWQSIIRWRRSGMSCCWWDVVLGFNVGIPLRYFPKFFLTKVMLSCSSCLFVVVIDIFFISLYQCFVSVCHLDIWYYVMYIWHYVMYIWHNEMWIHYYVTCRFQYAMSLSKLSDVIPFVHNMF